jgi:UDP-N-acetylmuramoyl-L-alanyl-D-glutamate--2,6-diaminopimelate ligase
MKLADVLKGIAATSQNADLSLEITGVSYDSRTTAGGNLFVAVRGFETDGHQFVGAAVGRGAACVLCEEEPDADVPYVVTDDTRLALAVAAANWFHHPASELSLVGVTGTNGKTTTTSLIKTVLEKCSGEKVGSAA